LVFASLFLLSHIWRTEKNIYRVIQLIVFFLNNVQERKVEKKQYVVMSLFFDEGCLMT
jgi:hypothetical protein